MRKYRRMTYTDRLIIEKLYKQKCSYRAIAGRIGFSVAAVYREVQRGLCEQLNGKTWETYLAYSATIADDDAIYQASAKGSAIKLGKHYDYAQMVADRIKAGEAPDAIVGDLRRRGEWTVSTPTLYRYIDQGYIPGITNKDLLCKSRMKKQGYRKVRAAKAPRGETIERRPSVIGHRSTFGHWEMDTVIGKAKGTGQTLLVLTERLTRFEIIIKLLNKTAYFVENALTKITAVFPKGTFKTFTVDNGCEFSNYGGLKQFVDEVYYCHPYTSCERGSNENANRLIRRFFPKGQSLAHVTQRDCDAVADFINHMHRKILNYTTSADLFNAHLATL